MHAGTTDIATAPLFTTSTTVVKPNVLFVLDDSGSMAWDFMPDDAKFGSSDYTSVYGRRAAQCNGLGFDPSKTYVLPLTASGTDGSAASKDFLSGTYVDSASFLTTGDVYNTINRNAATGTTTYAVVSSGEVTVVVSSTQSYVTGMVVSLFGSYTSGGRRYYSSNAYMIGKVTSWNSGTKTLKVDIKMSVGSNNIDSVYVGMGSPIDNVYYSYSGSQTKLGYVYTSSGVTANTFYNECSSSLGSDPGKSVFTANLVLPSSSDAQNYANWYYYYSTRMRMMKTSLTRAFSPLDDKYRIGFMTINGNTGGILDVKDFDSDQKTTFYSRVNGANPNNSTPLRAALSQAGLYYAKKISGQTYDPVQYSCQKNFTILSTDGYWNGNAGYKLDGSSAIGQQDGSGVTRPYYDGGVDRTTTTKTWTKTETGTRSASTARTTVGSTTTRKIETTTTPHTTLSYSKLYTRTISDVNRCGSGGGSCTITVETSGNHGYSTGDSVTMSTNISAYNGTFTITVVNSTTFTYVLPSRPSSPSSLTGSVAPSSHSCATVGQGQLITVRQTYTNTATKTTDTTVSTTTPGTSTTVYNLTRTTPMTQVLVYLDGVLQSDTTSSGSSTVTVGSVVSGPTVVDGATASTSSSSVSNSSSNSTPATTAGYPTYGSCSTTAAPADTDTAGSGSTATTGPTQTGSTGPTTTNGATTNTDSYPTSTNGAVTESSTVVNSGGSTDSLADVAMYYYKSDLRDSALGNCTGALGTSICENNVKSLGEDTATWQHMSTYTLGLGVNGLLTYKADYDTAETGDYKEIKGGNKNWPTPSSDAIANIDDLWHAAVNGRGRYFSATDPTTLAASLSAALNSIKAVLGASSAAATSTLQPVEGDNGVFIAQFMSSEWTGDLKAYSMNVKTGAVPTTDAAGNDISTWSASTQLTAAYERKIYYFKGATGNTGTLREFTYANLTADAMNGYFDNACSKSPSLTQCTGAGAALLSSLNSGANMVSFLRGQAQTQYRVRNKILGDIVNSSPVYVGKPGFSYTENSYATFKSSNASRAVTLYVGANDGMLHAFDATNGNERWAYMPRLVMDKVYRLGDSFYESKHLYTVDATPVVGDIYVGGAWKTILVGGLNSGGSGYYAIDVTNPASPVALWEFTDANQGLSYGNPIITKLKSGKWVVAFTSGYNNADGTGHLFVVDAATGEKLKDISTGVGTAANPSGLGKLNAWVDADTDNTALRYYAGDLYGNIWRFDVDGLLEPKNSAFKLGQAIKNEIPQPITTAPQIAEIEANGGKHAVVYFGTGRYLGKTDVTNADVQSIYAVKDALGSVSLGDLRKDGQLVQQEIVDPDATLRKVKDTNPVDWSSKNGWYLDLPSTRERINVDMQLAFNMLTAAGNIPGNTATDCDKAQDGTSYIYQLNVISGRGSAKTLSSMVAGLSTVQLADGTGVTVVTKTDASSPDPLTVPPSATTNSKARRSSWRELID
ncbi:PilC/PilY family type IV pilus protein [Pelomonas sp. SE-A7]|uniref:pilus assembly protein n=1 Tax=Pelomonas sp. SE-A7 TaxID=3054953 RepID=UPI00259C8E8A|nr:PilC/PilY family type IV pilus protein [Pelomonas sp. SE-A7]MDM4767711.1 PilC/PilY family type IV pilus protein [Pelomonas sp. SE-A7]